MMRVIEGLASDWHRLDERIEGLSSEIEELAKRDAECDRLMSVPGIGPIISSAMAAAIGTGDGFSKGRCRMASASSEANLDRGPHDPRQNIEAGQSLPARSVRKAAWAVPVKVKPTRWQGHGLRPWIEAAKKRLHHNVLAIALANKLARIAWSVLAHGRAFETNKLQAAA